MVLEILAMSEAAKRKWDILTTLERDLVDKSFLKFLTDPKAVLIYKRVSMTMRYEQGFRTYEVILIESEDCFFVMGVYQDKVPFLLDLVIKDDVCVLAH